MKSIVVYASRHGNTEKIAFAIAAGLRSKGAVEVLAVDKAHTILLHSYDLVVIGGPTEAHGMTKPIATYIEGIGGAFYGTPAAAFDTRLRWPRWLSGSAAAAIADRLETFGANVVAKPVSFFVEGKLPALEPGELERAEAWAISLAAMLQPHIAPASKLPSHTALS